MIRVALVRLSRAALVLLVATFGAFALISLLPGDTVTAVLGPGSTADERTEVRHDLRLDDPLPIRYGHWLGDAVRGDLGTSYRTHQPIAEAIRDRLPVTIELVVLANVIALAIAVPLAALAAARAGSAIDRFTGAATIGLAALPAYVVGVALLAVFAVRLQWFPSTGYTHLTHDPVGNVRSLLLPATALGVQEVAMYLRVLRADLVTALATDYVAAARARGVPPGQVLRRHALRPAGIGVLAVAGVTIGRTLGGTVLVEHIFGLPGLGRYVVESIDHRDYLAVQGAIVVLTVGFILINTLLDMAYGLLDPRVRGHL